METITAEAFIDNCQQAEDAETRARGRHVEIAMGRIASRVEIVMKGEPNQALAFVEANNDNVAYLSYDVTSDKETTLHALLHEADHNRLKFWDLPVLDNFTTDHAEILEAGCGFSLLNATDNVSLMEGFHEMLTIKRNGVDNQVAYKQTEVPAAQKLEKLGWRVLGISLFKIYQSGNHEKMARTLKTLADQCLMLKAAAQITDTSQRLLVETKIQQSTVEVTNAPSAQTIIDTYQAEIMLETLFASTASTKTRAA